MMTNIITPPSFKKSHIGPIPSDWSIRLLSETVVSVSNGITYDPDIKTGYPITRIETIADGYINEVMVGHTPFKSNFLKYKLKKGNILYSHINSINQIGKTAYCEKDYEILHGMNLLKIVTYAELNSKFLYYLFNSNLGKKQAYSYSKRAVNQASLSTSDIKKFIFPIPPIPEQEFIVNLLSTWDRAIENTQKLIKQKELRKKWLMQMLLTGKKRVKGFNGKWKECNLGSLGNTYTGLTGKFKDDFGIGKPYIPYLNIFFNTKIDLTNLDYVNITERDKQNKTRYGDIFFTISSETPDEVGMASVLLDHVNELYLNSFCFGFRLYNFDTLIPEFSSYYLRADAFREEIYKLSQGATRFNLSKNSLMKLNVILPSPEEQIAIAQVLQAADKEIQTLNNKLEKLKEQKKGLMQVLLTGKKRLKIS